MGPAPVGREVGRAVPDHGTPFFLSYARASESSSTAGMARYSDQMTERFCFDLSENVRQLISLRPGSEFGFMDTGMQGGMHWTPELIDAIGTCQVLVALLSVPYLESEWCGMEWHAFSQRRAVRVGSDLSRNQGCIIPVRWAPISCPLPPLVSKCMTFSPVSRRNPQLLAEYNANGIFGLLRAELEDSYSIIAWQLALLISKIYYGQHLQHRKFKLENLRNVFQGALP
jgi:hypothetical protein